MQYLSKTNVLFSILFLFNPTYLTSGENEEKPFVVCTLHGQLGNQMHEIATTLAYAWDHNMEPFFPDLEKNDWNLSMNYKRLFFRLNASPPPRPILHSYMQDHYLSFDKVDIPVRPDQSLWGCFQTWKNYHHHRDKLLSLFAPSTEELNSIKLKHAELLNHPCTVGIHVRTFNKEWSNAFPFVGLAYYDQAMGFFPSEALFIVFSDRINWCKHHFAKFNRKIIFIEGQDHIEDFFLMSLLKHNIIGNSSYSWWAAYLNENTHKVVVAPSHFVHPNLRPTVNANMPDWITLNIDYEYRHSSYPEDIRDYDQFSTSIDTQ